MKKYIMYGTYCPDVLTKREPFREQHLNHLKELKKTGVLEKAGPTKDLKNIFAIFCHDDENLIKNEIEKDVYWENGIWTGYELKEWIDAV